MERPDKSRRSEVTELMKGAGTGPERRSLESVGTRGDGIWTVRKA